MADNTPIEWADATVNYINGCSLASPGCTNCYAMKLAGTRMKQHASRQGLTIDSKAGPVWTGEVRRHEPALFQPLHWRRPRTIFWNAHGDLFHPSVPDEWIDRQFAVMALTPRHRHLILTKRSGRMRDYMPAIGGGDEHRWRAALASVTVGARSSLLLGDALEHLTRRGPLFNVWAGVSIEDRDRLIERAYDLNATPGAGRFWSAEPLLGDLGEIPRSLFPDGVIVGGESGPRARPMEAAWARSLRDQCAAAGVDFHFKQWGEFRPTSDCNGPYMMRVGKKAAGRDLDGVTHDALPWRRVA